MNLFWRLFPAGLAALALAAHFLRRGQMVGTLAGLGLVALLLVRRRWARRVVQWGLVLGSLEWLLTLRVLMDERRAAGEPAARLVGILGAVVLLTLAAAGLLGSAPVRRHFLEGPSPGGEEP
jgi:hypothetical protein